MIPSDPDIQTIVSRIDSGDILLRPNFQRGEVWTKLKKQKLIDSILRDWHIPPVHVIDNPDTEKQEVLDGQQRLTAIRDFVHDEFPVDGRTEPSDEIVRSLDGLFYSHLDPAWKRRINHYAIRLFRLTEYRPGEPWELFFRLNQSTRLTGAEERNAFFGPVREQIKEAVSLLQKIVSADQFLGFSNARMAYDDVLSRTALAIDRRNLSEKITAADLTDLYRRDASLEPLVVDRLIGAIAAIGYVAKRGVRPLRMNKATVFTWLIFVTRAIWNTDGHLYEPFLHELEGYIIWFNGERLRVSTSIPDSMDRKEVMRSWLFYILDDRSSSRVADTSSVLLRDAILWKFYLEYVSTKTQPEFVYRDHKKLSLLSDLFEQYGTIHDEDEVVRRLFQIDWGYLP